MRRAAASAPRRQRTGSGVLTIAEALPEDRDPIDRLRHDVYARELGQYPLAASGRLADAHPHSTILCAKMRGQVVGFIAITPAGSPSLRIEHYLPREQFPFAIGPKTAEVRQLTVAPEARAGTAAVRLLLACIEWLEATGAEEVLSMGHDRVIPLYERWGATRTGLRLRAGKVDYEILRASMGEDHRAVAPMASLRKLIQREDACVLHAPEIRCAHGGAALSRLDAGLRELDRLDAVVGADALDAWFAPSPEVVRALAQSLPVLCRTSPPEAGALGAKVAERYGIHADNVVFGAGSSDLIYRALTAWLAADSRVLVLDPSYAEYAHVAEQVVGCSVTRLVLERTAGYGLSLERLRQVLSAGFDLVVVVNPNNPTGQHLDRALLAEALRLAPSSTRIWIDEAYIHYVGEEQSLLSLVPSRRNLFVCRTLSKSLALSGLRVAFLAGPAQEVAEIRRRTPPWVVGFPAQIAVLRALDDGDYYEQRYRETDRLRGELAGWLRDADHDVIEGRIASVLVHLPDEGPTAREVVQRCRVAGVFLRDAGDMGQSVGTRVLRISVKDRASNVRIAETLARVLGDAARGRPV